MGRPNRVNDGGPVYPVLNRANARIQIFDKAEAELAAIRHGTARGAPFGAGIRANRMV